MASSFASIHFIGKNEFNENYIDLIKPYLKRGITFGFGSLSGIEILAVKTDYGFGLFCEDFGMESIDQIACKCYKDEKVSTIVTAGILDGDIISVSIIQHGTVISNITLRSSGCYEDIYEDIKEQWYHCEYFEELFGVSRENLEQSVEEDMLDTLVNWAELLGIPFSHPYYSAEESFEKSNQKKFCIKTENVIKDAKIINIEDFAKDFMKYLNF